MFRLFCTPSSKETQSIAGAVETADAATPGWGGTAIRVKFVLEVRDGLTPGPCLEDGLANEVGVLGSSWTGAGRDGPVISAKSAMSGLGIGSSISSSEMTAVGLRWHLPCLHAFSCFFIRFLHSMAETNF